MVGYEEAPARGVHVNGITLDSLLEEATSGETVAEVPRPPIAKMNYSHKAMADLIIANPGISQNSIAAAFGYSASWVSTVMSSDAFQAYLATRSEELVDPTVRASVEERFKGMVARSLAVLEEKLNRPTSLISEQFALRSFELSTRAAGYGARSDHAPKVTPTEVHVHLDLLAARMTGLLQRKRVEALVLDQEIFDASK
jgi:hypothetical protein